MIIKWATALRRWNTGNTSRYVVFPPVRENCLQEWKPWLVLLCLRRRNATEDFWKLGMSCFRSPLLLKHWVLSQTPKKSIFPKAFKKQRKQRKRKILPSQEEGKATDDPTPPTT